MINPQSLYSATATAADVARNFGRFKELAQRGPVAVTSHGRESVVLLSVDEYIRLKALDDRVSLNTRDLPPQFVEALERIEIPEWTKAFDHELKAK